MADEAADAAERRCLQDAEGQRKDHKTTGAMGSIMVRQFDIIRRRAATVEP
jgi:hypothetical protein